MHSGSNADRHEPLQRRPSSDGVEGEGQAFLHGAQQGSPLRLLPLRTHTHTHTNDIYLVTAVGSHRKKGTSLVDNSCMAAYSTAHCRPTLTWHAPLCLPVCLLCVCVCVMIISTGFPANASYLLGVGHPSFERQDGYCRH